MFNTDHADEAIARVLDRATEYATAREIAQRDFAETLFAERKQEVESRRKQLAASPDLRNGQ